MMENTVMQTKIKVGERQEKTNNNWSDDQFFVSLPMQKKQSATERSKDVVDSNADPDDDGQ